MNTLILTVIALVLSFVSAEEVRSLCDNPIITAADRLPNNVYRVYRDNYYWELVGLPARKARFRGPFPVSDAMKPVDRLSSVQTVIGGSADGYTWKFREQKFWLFGPTGQLKTGGKNGWYLKDIPPPGFDAVLNDGKMGKKGYPIMIGFKAITVYYYNTESRTLRLIGSQKNGMFGEKFPPDLTAAFAFPSTEEDVDYYVYLFRRHEYCYRPIKGEDGCKEWRNNTELFGCSVQSGPNTESPQIEPKATESLPEKPPQDTGGQPSEIGNQDQGNNDLDSSDSKPNSDSESSGGGGGTFLIVIIVVVLVVLAVVIGIVVFSMRGKPQSTQASNKSRAQAPPPKSKTGFTPKAGKPMTSKK